MLLEVNGEFYTAHFKHRIQEFYQNKKGKQVMVGLRDSTKCVFHAGKCTVEHCAMQGRSEFASVEVAVCNPGDQFSKVKGRIGSLTKALKRFDRPLRKQIWEAYFKISPHK